MSKKLEKLDTFLLAIKNTIEGHKPTFEIPILKTIFYKDTILLCLHNSLYNNEIVLEGLFEISEYKTGRIVSYRPDKRKTTLIKNTIERLDNIPLETILSTISGLTQINFERR